MKLSYGIKDLEWSAFHSCHGLTSVIIPSSITKISIGTFSDCVNLQSINIPYSVTSIENSAFYGCSKLKGVNFPELIHKLKNEKIIAKVGSKTTTVKSKLTYIGDSAFACCSVLEGIAIPESIIYIDDNAFLSSGIKIAEINSKFLFGANVFTKNLVPLVRDRGMLRHFSKHLQNIK